ncbi:ZIP family metal transporter [Rhodopirellula sp. JC639]|uniref:ZIP family metal transporter n=1 Tax=Stieleria mannarensis TaxID=2755585 RepID=UPI00160125E1|nr:ZIP family metal transporter [Rhodopirellula sp. JC639]
MTTLLWIILFGFLMSCIALVGSVTLVLKQQTLDRILLPLVAFAAGSLIGGASFHMIPAAVEAMDNALALYIWLVAGFILFLALEQFLNWHHSHSQAPSERQPLTYLILIADAVHNFIGGLFVGASFLINFRLGLVAWLAAAAHEVPQELGDFGVLVHGGWSKSTALVYNFVSALTFLAGGLVAYFASARIDVVFLIPFAAGNFLYIAAADLIPEIKKSHDIRTNALHFAAFVLGVLLLLVLRLVFPHS